MSEIKLVKRIKYAGDVHSALMELGWDAKTAAAFLDDIPDADAETVFEQIGLVKEAFDMAKSSLVPVVTHTPGNTSKSMFALFALTIR